MARNWKGIILHHSVSPALTTARQIDKWHKERGFRRALADGRVVHIGYHFVVRQKGDRWIVEPGRPLSVTGAHCRGGKNTTHIGVCLAGDFMKDEVPRGQLQKTLALCARLARQFNFGPEAVLGHRQAWPTNCPGANFDLAGFRARLARIIHEVS